MMKYLAAPYQHPDPAVRAARMKVFHEHDAQLMREGHFTVSPLAKVETAKYSDIPDTWAYWELYSYELLSRCDEMIVLMIDGWKESVGVAAEIAYCEKHNIPISYRNILYHQADELSRATLDLAVAKLK
jgi:Domain of unknown function (DUF1937)